jgi:hypothetical protein
MLRTLPPLCLLLLLACLCPAQSPSNSSTDLLGKWTVANVLCTDCANRTPSEKGSVLEFAPSFIHNPLSEDCKADPDYSRLEPMSGARAVTHHGKHWPQGLRHVASKQSKVRYGFITCGGINLMQVLALSNQRAFYFFEGGIVFDLRRPDH